MLARNYKYRNSRCSRFFGAGRVTRNGANFRDCNNVIDCFDVRGNCGDSCQAFERDSFIAMEKIVVNSLRSQCLRSCVEGVWRVHYQSKVLFYQNSVLRDITNAEKKIIHVEDVKNIYFP